MKAEAKNGNPYFKRRGQTTGPHLMEILEDISKHLSKPINLIIETPDKDEYFVCRCLYCYVACKLTNATLKQIGDIINKDHSMVIYYRDRFAYWVKTGDPKWIDTWFDWLERTEIWGKYEKE